MRFTTAERRSLNWLQESWRRADEACRQSREEVVPYGALCTGAWGFAQSELRLAVMEGAARAG